jgi:hypothetical protein
MRPKRPGVYNKACNWQLILVSARARTLARCTLFAYLLPPTDALPMTDDSMTR